MADDVFKRVTEMIQAAPKSEGGEVIVGADGSVTENRWVGVTEWYEEHDDGGTIINGKPHRLAGRRAGGQWLP